MQVIDMRFQVSGHLIPVDHGAYLHAALSRVIPLYHEENDIILRRITGRYAGLGLLDITSPHSCFTLRLPYGKRSMFRTLVGRRFTLDKANVRVSTFHVFPLEPADPLYSDLVTTRGAHDEARFRKELTRQLSELGANPKIEIQKRKVYRIHGYRLVGYSVLLSGLNDEASLAVQANGVGGRNRMGAGFFEPFRENGNGG